MPKAALFWYNEFMVHNSKLRGFTIIEVLVVLFILGIVSLIVVIDFRASQRRFAVQNAAQQLSLDMRRAQALALQARKESSGIPDGYGIYINIVSSTSYILYGDVNDNNSYDGSEGLKNIEFPRGAHLRDNLGDSPTRVYDADGTACGPGPNADSDTVHLTFRPPDPEVIILGDSADPCFKACIIIDGEATLSRIVGVSQTGLVNVYSGSNALNDCASDF